LYEELYEAWQKEKESAEIQKLSKDFYAKLSEYVKKLREETRMLDRKTTKARLIKQEFENVKNMVQELFKLRYQKTMKTTLARKTVSKEVLTDEEEKLYEEILPLAESYQSLLQDILRGRLSHTKKKEKPEKIALRFIKEIPAVIGSDMKTYGPFMPEDIATLPIENARILISQGADVEVETKETK
jgi:DNA replication initiation complex subunit (GINS family)